MTFTSRKHRDEIARTLTSQGWEIKDWCFEYDLFEKDGVELRIERDKNYQYEG